MSLHHPNERQLLAFLNNRRVTRGSGRLEAHLRQCRECRTKLDQYRRLELELERLPLEEPDPGLTVRIMEAIRNPAQPQTDRHPSGKFVKPEFINGFIALAATYLFVSTGVWQHIVSISPVTLGTGVENRVQEAIKLVEKLTRLFTA